jgi:hypothetical protein
MIFDSSFAADCDDEKPAYIKSSMSGFSSSQSTAKPERKYR